MSRGVAHWDMDKTCVSSDGPEQERRKIRSTMSTGLERIHDNIEVTTYTIHCARLDSGNVRNGAQDPEGCLMLGSFRYNRIAGEEGGRG